MKQHLANDIKQQIQMSIWINISSFSLEIVLVLTLSANVEMCCDINVFPNQHMALILILQGNILAVVWRKLLENGGR